ncbi:MAG: S-adenosylmethionine synthase [candidate division WS2 bacterium ADurb.Bin280]|uniref:S-adenosylmethionine synthase n=1 Tax=candidate division WS2 bacterium ADurb.Bin280 TaxID=1852829 RepID=A0A1V5SEV8_9BACT|nr:MAG: S-adenosylmethionine synthase [candidate division WS2 bacterium ADurb.Bin280]
MSKKLFTSESVTEGHPDKMADQISDSILDALIEKDLRSRVAVETLLTNGVCIIAGEVTTSAYVDMAKIARDKIKEIGYDGCGFHHETSGVMIAIKEQSSDIARGVDSFKKKADGTIVAEDLENLGAGDQGLMFGFACDETPELMPLPIVLSHRICQRLAEVRKKNIIKGLRPDGKSQVTIEYIEGRPKRVHTVLVAAQHDPDKNGKTLESEIKSRVIQPVLKEYGYKIDSKTKIYINTAGRWVIGGPEGDTGLTGRKIIVDTYGGYARHGGGAFSGKDPSKVDRSGSYAARWVAKNIVASGLARKCEVQIAYAIGKPEPLSVYLESFGTSEISNEELERVVVQNFDLRPGKIIEKLGLRRPIYAKVAVYGHFGRGDLDLPWEDVSIANKLKSQRIKAIKDSSA